MTTAQMKRVAKNARRYGHYLSGTALWVYCPLCRNRVETPREYGAVAPQLDAAMVNHLIYDHASDQ